MITDEEFEKFYRKKRTKYFKTHFIDKDIRTAMYETLENLLLELAAMQTKICIQIDCLTILKSDKEFFNNLDKETRKAMKINIIGYKLIRRDLDKILEPIAKGLNGEM